MARTVELEVHGMSCGGCVRSVSKIIGRKLGLEPEKVDVDLDAERARFETDADTSTLDATCQSLTEQGFESKVLTH